MKLKKCFPDTVVLLSMALFGLFACGTDVAELQQIEQRVMDVHDEVMPKMDDLNNTRKKLIVAVQLSDSVPDRDQVLTAIDKLEEADSLMWDWMHNYSRPDYEGNLDSVRIYLESELNKVNLMKEKFMTSLSEGDALVEKLKTSEE